MNLPKSVYDYHGKAMSVSELAQIATNGITIQSLRYRLQTGYSVEDAITKPIAKRRKHKSREEEPLPCGATSPFDCLNCKLASMPCLNWPVLPGEGANDYVFTDYNNKQSAAGRNSAKGTRRKSRKHLQAVG